jgi:hypothetical protein
MDTGSTSWKATEIWQTLEQHRGRGADAVRNALRFEKCMDTIEAWLKHAAPDGTADFTLHDHEHGFRVAQRMAQVMPKDVLPKLSAYELALLLMSAYLHDIGMTPKRGLVKGLWSYLAFDSNPAETSNILQHGLTKEFPEFCRYLNENGVKPGLLLKHQDASMRGTIDELIAYYCRRRHNAWSEAWINEHLQGQNLGEFQNWLNDLTDLCLSHHYGKEKLLSARFDPRSVSNPGEMVNLRYLACVLRVADILENDPKRTPEIIFKQRDVQSSSRIYWFKDHEFRCQIVPAESGGGRKLIVSARPKRAAMERACRDTMEAIAAELELCRAIHEEKPFDHARGQKCEQYKWDLLDLITDDIRNADGTYVYIDGAFRPDTKRILQLLSGNALYSESLAAVRELLQNAFDAIRESIAHDRLSYWESLQSEEKVGYDWSMYNDVPRTVTLRLESETGQDGIPTYWLTCTDGGIGMSRSILERHLLVSGAAPRTELQDLERQCGAAGFSLGRTGQFGIGVLSYFMIADRVEIWTRRDPRGGSDDGTGWHFETEGVGTFGELRKAPDAPLGTKVRLRLRKDLLGGSVQAWGARLSEYVRETLIRVPCRVRFEDTCDDGEAFALDRGWALRPEERFDLLVSKSNPNQKHEPSDSEIVTSALRKAQTAEDEQWNRLREKMRLAIRWQEVSGDLPDHLGQYRVHIPYFDLMGGISLAFLDLEQGMESLYCMPFLKHGACHSNSMRGRLAWKGMRTVGSGFSDTDIGGLFDAYMGLVEIDMTSSSAGVISVDRDRLGFSGDSQRIYDPINVAIRGVLRSLASRIAEGVHFLISQGCVKFDLGVRSSDLYWPGHTPNPLSSLGPNLVRVTDRFIVAGGHNFHGHPRFAKWKSIEKVFQLHVVETYGPKEQAKDLLPNPLYFASPDRVVQYMDADWDDDDDSLSHDRKGKLVREVGVLWSAAKPNVSRAEETMCRFPPAWNHVVGLVGNLPTLLNVDNVAVAIADKSDLQRFLGTSPAELFRVADAAQRWTLSERARIAAWLIACAIKSTPVGWQERYDRNCLWSALQESASSALVKAWHFAFGSTGGDASVASLCVLAGASHWDGFRFDPSASEFIVLEREQFVPDAGPEWTVFSPSVDGAPQDGSAAREMKVRARDQSKKSKTKAKSSDHDNKVPSVSKRKRPRS